MSKRDNIGMTIGDFKIIDVSPEGRYVVQCLVCKRIQTLGVINAFKKRINKHGKICSIILSNEYGGDFKNGELKQFHSIWCNLRNRTNNPNYEKWKQYGGRGINSTAFEHFVDFYDTMYESYIDHVNKYGKNNTTIDRIDVNGNYEPENCRWISQKEQMRNTRSNHLLTYNGCTKTMAEWAEITGIPYSTLKHRINKYNYSVEKALTKPVKTSRTERYSCKNGE